MSNVVSLSEARRGPECLMSHIEFVAVQDPESVATSESGRFLDEADESPDNDRAFKASCKVVSCEVVCSVNPGPNETFVELVRTDSIRVDGVCIEGYY